MSCSKGERTGTAVVELAVSLPLLSLLVFGSITASNAIFLRHGLTTASYEAAQTASAFGGTSASARQRAEQVLASYDVKGYEISITPQVDSETEPLTPITVAISAPASANGYILGWIFPNLVVRGSTTMGRL